MKQQLIYAMLGVLVTGSVARGQDYKTDFAKINSAYNAENNIAIDLSYKYYSNPLDKVPADSLKGRMVLYHKEYTCNIGDINMVRNGKYLVAVDKSHKTIFLGDAKHSTVPIVTFDVLDSLVRQKEVTVGYSDLNGEEGIYQVNEKKGNAYRYDIYFDKQSYLINEIDIYYHYLPGEQQKSTSHPLLRVYYLNCKKSNPDISVFSEANYVNIQNKTIVPVVAYRSYKIVNNLNP